MSESPCDTTDPLAVTIVNPAGTSRYVLTCDHASNHMPARYRGLGLAEAERARHIAWDIGAADLARALAARLDAALFLSGYSRLLIDCNRPLTSPTSIVTRSEDTEIVGNLSITEAERTLRAERFFAPYQAAIATCLDERVAAGKPTLLVGIHSFTPIYRQDVRRWHAGVLYGEAVAFGQALLMALREAPDLTIGDNEPYRVSLETDHTVPVHGDARGIPALLIEVRQDLIGDPAGVAAWALLLETALRTTAQVV